MTFTLLLRLVFFFGEVEMEATEADRVRLRVEREVLAFFFGGMIARTDHAQSGREYDAERSFGGVGWELMNSIVVQAPLQQSAFHFRHPNTLPFWI